MTQIDAVVTWVDGNDSVHIQKRAAIMGQGRGLMSDTIPAGVDQIRFENNNEIEYCLRSLRRFAPWLRTIFLVTDQQCPAFLDEQERAMLGVRIVDHRQIFSGHERVLPTFNSLSIETVLHRIPGLSEHYIYLNDDFILMAPVRPGDFFTEDGVVLRGAWEKLHDYGPVRLALSKALNHFLAWLFGIHRAMSVLQQMRGARLAGYSERFFKVGHSPYPMRKSVLERFFAENPGALLENIQYQFRDLKQYAVTSLSNHLEMLAGKATLIGEDGSLMVCFNRDSRREIRRKLDLVRAGDVRFLCIQSLEQASAEDRSLLVDLVRQRVLG